MIEKDFEYKPYGEKTIQELDEEVDYLMEQTLKWNFYRLLLVVFFIGFLFRDSIWFQLSHAFPIPTRYSSAQININQEPIQLDIINNATTMMRARDGEKEEFSGQFINTSEEDLAYINKESPPMLAVNMQGMEESERNRARLLPMAFYSISGRTVAINYFFDILKGDFDRVALFDIGLTWCKTSNKKYLEDNYSFSSEKLLYNRARALHIQPKKHIENIEYDIEHISHTHVIPANNNILSALMKLKKYDLIRMDGFLVDVFVGDAHLKGSLSRSDSNETSRGNGACEVMYVTRVKLGHFIYE